MKGCPCGKMCEADEAYPVYRCEKIVPKTTLHRYEEALKMISKNSCCGSCQEAKLVAKQALEGEK